MKGKLNQLNSDGDIATLYDEFARRKCLLFWIKCLAKAKETTFESTSSCPPSKRSGSIYDSTLQKVYEVDVIVDDLEEKHDGKYTREQIRCWANMIQIKQHDTYEG